MPIAFLSLLALSAASTFVPALPEALAVTYVEKLHWSRLLVATMVATGQCISFSLLYLFGEWAMRKWTRLANEVARVRERFSNHLEERFLLLTIPSGVLGFPPAVAMSALAPGFEIPFRHVLPVLFATRIVRFAVLIAFGHTITHWLHAFP